MDEENWSRWWWVPLAVVVMAAATWGVLGLVEGGCERGPRGGCVAADGYKVRGWVLFLAAMPSYVVLITGLVTDRWPPALGVAVGGVACGLFALTQGRTVPHLTVAGVLLVLAVVAPVLAWRRRGVRAR
ncbi:hypothetical protein C3489_28805 [Streptomyces sp. Ru71]|uniref:hypothetical protein n=1 Tax=Streptomyces sp. Ru71 TaxID=2080746 RepID=UPI000CDD2F80|nr:hypothetical protein [Streptomyces sp. Ru71]POX47819.1 hypothetical protein C3489_28805 [Streptomyces sp. Ru71]